MNAHPIRSGLIVVAVIAFVGTVAWFKTDRSEPMQSSREAAADVSEKSSPSPTPSKQRLPRLVDLGAGKCKACKEMAPILEAVRKEYVGRAVVEFIDVWKNPEAAEPYDVRIIPTQIFYDRDGQEVWRHEGALSKSEIAEKLKRLGA